MKRTYYNRSVRHWIPGKLALLLGAFWIMLLSACSDDFDNNIYQKVEQTNNITLHIPSVKGVALSRAGDLPADGNVSIAEGRIESLALYAYPTDGGEGRCIRLAEPAQLTQEYATYKFTLDPGSYRVYLVGNLNPYLEEDLTDDISESLLKQQILNFGAEKMPNLEDGLPMACFPGDILENEGGEISVSSHKGATITADLKFLCSKVRLTLFYDSKNADSFSTEAFGSQRPGFGGFSILNLADRTHMDSSIEPQHGFFASESTFTRMNYPEGIESEEDVKNYTDLHTMTPSEETSPTERMTWQTTVYLPENLSSDPKKATTFDIEGRIVGSDRKIYYSVPLPGLSAESESSQALPLKRAEFHDLSACLKSINDFEVTSRIEDWTVRSLAHNLHGPYFLQVEKTEKVPVTAGEETHLWYSSDVPVMFESQQEEINGKMTNVLVIEKMTNHENDSIVITANPALPVNYDLSEAYFHIIAGNIRKHIQVWPFTVKPFFKVTPTYSVIEVREMIESGKNTLSLPIKFTTNLEKVTVRLLDGWDEENAQVEFKTASTSSSQRDKELTYEGDLAKDGKNLVDMNGFITGNSYWSEGHKLRMEYTAYDEDGNVFGNPIISEIDIVPKRFSYRIYFRSENDDWVNPHVYIYESLALPFTLDKTKVEGPYKDRAGKPVGGYVYRDLDKSPEAGLKYSYTGKISFRGWSTQGGPACNDPYEAAMFDPKTTQGFYVFGSEIPPFGENIGKIGYGVKYIPPQTRENWWVSGASEEIIRERYDIDTDFMGAHRARIAKSCPLCADNDKYNIKFPGIRMEMSKEHPGWWYVDLTEVAAPGKTLIMFHDGHESEGYLIVPGDNKPGVPLFDFPDNEGWLYYDISRSPVFVNDKPADLKKYEEEIYRFCWSKNISSGVTLSVMNGMNSRVQGDIMTALRPGQYNSWDSDFNYVEFRLSKELAGRYLKLKMLSQNGNYWEDTYPLYLFKEEDGIKYLTYNGDEFAPGKPESSLINESLLRIYWPQSSDVKGLNMWFDGWVVNNYDNKSASYLPKVIYKTGSEIIQGMVYDYFEFFVPDRDYTNAGWQMHLASQGTYRYPVYFSISEFTDPENKGFRAMYRDGSYSIHLGSPPSLTTGSEYRIYWPMYFTSGGTQHDINVAWFWGVNDRGINNTDGHWIYPTGSTKLDGVDYYYFDFTETADFMPPTSAGIIPRSAASWTSGVQPNSKNIELSRTAFRYDSTLGKNVIRIVSDFSKF